METKLHGEEGRHDPIPNAQRGAPGRVLAILSQRETYGYEIVQALEAYGFGTISEGRCTPLPSAAGKGGAHPGPVPGLCPGPPDGSITPLTEQGREELAQFHASFQAMAAVRWPSRLALPPKRRETP